VINTEPLSFAASSPLGRGLPHAERRRSLVSPTSPLGSARAQLESRVDRLYSNAMSAEAASADFEQELISEFSSLSLDLNKICRLIPRVRNYEVLRNVFIKNLDVSRAIEVEDKARLIELILTHGNLCEEDRNRIFRCGDIMTHMDKDDLVGLYLSSKRPFEAPAFIAVVGEARIKDLFHFCLKHNLGDSILELSLRMPDSVFKRFVQVQLSVGSDASLRLLSRIPVDHLVVARDAFLSHFEHLPEVDFNHPPNLKLANAFFLSEEVADYLFEGAEPPKLEHQKSAFSLLLKYSSSLDESLSPFITMLATDIFPLDPSYVSNVCAQFFLSEDVPLTTTWIQLIDYLSVDAVNQLVTKLEKLIKKGGDFASQAKSFINITKKRHISIWKLSGPYDHLSNLLLVSKGTQIGKDGLVDLSRAQNIISSLNWQAPNSISFCQDDLVEELEGGVCSAMAFDFLSQFERQPDYLDVSERFKQIQDSILLVEPNHRTVQAAYNTISRADESQPFSEKFNRAKIEALLKYECPLSSVISQSPTFNLDLSNSNAKITSYLEILSDGKYIVRSLQPHDSDSSSDSDEDLEYSSNSKGESYGHTTLLIKEEGSTYYYDPAVGIVQFTDPAHFPMILSWEHERWSLPQVTLYQISN
jgi:hypothetical protein